MDGTNFSDGPENVVEELSALLKAGVASLNTSLESGAALEDAFKSMQFSISIGTSYFVEIAKIRAFHLLWANIQKAYKRSSLKLPSLVGHFHKNTMQSEPNYNMIQSTTQAMAAVLGGVKRLYVPPANLDLNDPDPFYMRIARNLQHILKMESFLDQVVDPAAGSYYIGTIDGSVSD